MAFAGGLIGRPYRPALPGGLSGGLIGRCSRAVFVAAFAAVLVGGWVIGGAADGARTLPCSEQEVVK